MVESGRSISDLLVCVSRSLRPSPRLDSVSQFPKARFPARDSSRFQFGRCLSHAGPSPSPRDVVCAHERGSYVYGVTATVGRVCCVCISICLALFVVAPGAVRLNIRQMDCTTVQ